MTLCHLSWSDYLIKVNCRTIPDFIHKQTPTLTRPCTGARDLGEDGTTWQVVRVAAQLAAAHARLNARDVICALVRNTG